MARVFDIWIPQIFPVARSVDKSFKLFFFSKGCGTDDEYELAI
jgi:hypothetical protein